MIADPPDVYDGYQPAGMDGISGTGKLTEQIPELNIIVLTIQDDPDLIYQSLCAGATGYLLKDTPPGQTACRPLKRSNRAGLPMSPSIARKVTMSFRPAVNYDLSDREKEILTRLTQGRKLPGHSSRTLHKWSYGQNPYRNIYPDCRSTQEGEAVSTALRNKIV